MCAGRCHQNQTKKEKAKDREAWRAAVHGVEKSRQDWPTELTENKNKKQNFQLFLQQMWVYLGLAENWNLQPLQAMVSKIRIT